MIVNRERLIAEIARKYGISYDKADEVVRSQFKFVRKVMEEGDKELGEFNNVRLPRFGVFKVDKRRVKHLNKKKENNDD